MNRFKSIIIENLFGSFTHKISLSKDSNITMILGRNGLGKTVVLKIIQAIFNGDLFQLENIEFSRIVIEFNEDEKWIISKINFSEEISIESELEGENSFFHIDLNYYYKEDFVEKLDIAEINKNFNKLKRILHRLLPSAIRLIDNDEWFDRRTEERFTTYQIIDKYRSSLPDSIIKENIIYPDWFNDKINDKNVSLIETQRLLTLSNDSDDFKYRDSNRNIL